MSHLFLPTNIGSYVFIEQIKLIGNVWKAVDKDTQKQVMIKIINKDVLKDTKIQNAFMLELGLLKRNHHKLSSNYHNVLDDDNCYYLVFDFPENENLTSYIKNHNIYDDQPAKEFVAQLIDFFNYYQASEFKNTGIIITPDTVYVSPEGHINQIYVSVEGDPLICSKPETIAALKSPETVNNQQAVAPTYTWVCGVFLYYLKTGNFPFHGSNVGDIERSILMDQPDFPENEKQHTSDDIKSLIKKLLVKNPVTRIPLTAIRNLPQMKSVEASINNSNLPTDRVNAKFQSVSPSRGPALLFNSYTRSSQKSPEKMSVKKVGSKIGISTGSKVTLVPKKHIMASRQLSSNNKIASKPS